ncbi:MAG: SRPBCC family protein [Acidobacteriota bacterium]
MINVDDLSRIDRSIEIGAPPDRVWRALTSPEELGAWFRVTIEGDLLPGHAVWMTSRQPGYEGVRFEVRIVEMTRPSRVVWEWHPGAVDPAIDYSKEPCTTVTFTLEPSAGGTRLTVSETGFDRIPLARRAKAHHDNTGGWTEVVVWLKQHAETTS